MTDFGHTSHIGDFIVVRLNGCGYTVDDVSDTAITDIEFQYGGTESLNSIPTVTVYSAYFACQGGKTGAISGVTPFGYAAF